MYRVRKRSSWEGVARPLGWLWARTTTVAFKARASVVIFLQADLVGVGGALAEGTHAQELALAVEAGQEGLLVPGPKEVGGEQGVQGGAVREDDLRAGAGGQVPGSDGGDQLEEDHRVFPHAGDLAQVIGGGVQHPAREPKVSSSWWARGSHPPGGGSRRGGLQHPGF